MAETIAADGSARATRRHELRQLNLAAWDRDGEPDDLGKLDTSLKRHTALLVRLRSSLHTPASVPSILKDIASLALEKYVEEAVGAVVEGLVKCKTGPEVAGAVEIVSALHQRFPQLFTVPFIPLLLSTLKPTPSTATDKDIREKEDSFRVARQRGLLRVLGELEVVAVVRKDAGVTSKGAGAGATATTGDVTWGVLKELLTADKALLPLAAPLAIAFVKHLGPLYLPATSFSDAPDEVDFPSLNTTATEGTVPGEVTLETKDRFKKLLVAYFDALGRGSVKAHVELQKTDKRNHEAYIRSGEVFEDREKGYEKSVRAWERAWASVTQLSELLALPLPTLPSLSSTLQTSIVSSSGPSSFVPTDDVGGPGSLWADEEDRKFYEELRELSREVPSGILGVKVEATEAPGPLGGAGEKEKEGEGGHQVEGDIGKEEEAQQEEEGADEKADETVPTENPTDLLASEVAAESTALPAGPAAQLTALLARLEDASSITSIDAISLEFAFLNSKAARKRLAKFLGSVNRNRQEIIPYYSRLVGTLDPYMPDIGKDLIAILDEEFRFLQRKRNADMAETRSKNFRFLSELTKFRVTPTHVIFHVLKVLLDDFSGPNIDNLCTVLESCGRFLLRSEGTHERMSMVLETMKRKKSAMNLDARQVTMLENAYYQCDPPDRPVVAPKERTPMQLYIRHIIYNTLTRNSSDKVLKLIRKLHWEDPAVVQKLHSAFTKVWKIKYSNVHLFAVLLYDLGRYHPEFSASVIDEVLENIRVGMEINSFKYNQQRIATVKYLGELYNYRVIDSRVIFDTLWSLVTFGHPEGRPWPDVPSPIDPVDDCFRVRLTCTLLDTCGSCFERGALKKKLDSFLTFFQMYILSKGSMPMDVDFMVTDTFEQLRPNLKLFKTFGEAAVAVEEMMAAVAKNGPIEEDPEEIEGEGDVGPRNGAEDEVDANANSSSSEDEDSDSNMDSSEPEEEGGRGIDPNAMTREEEDDFSRELAKMMVNTGEIRKAPERKALDVGVPFIRKQRQVRDEEEETASPSSGMKFTLLTKKGTKQQTFSMEIPRESSIAVHTLEKRAQEKKEQQEMKRRVLDYEQREEETEKDVKAIILEKTQGDWKPGTVYHPATLTDLPVPVPAPDQVLVKIRAAAYNHRDVFTRQSLYPGVIFSEPGRPSVFGADAAGVVVSPGHPLTDKPVLIHSAVGWKSDVNGPEGKIPFGILGAVGQTGGRGTFAEYIVVGKDDVVPMPDHLVGLGSQGWAEAAAIPLGCLTAYRAVFTKAQVQKGQNVLVTGIGGGVALLALQYCVALGANVWVSSSSEEKIAKAVKLGAKGGVNYKDPNWPKLLAAQLPKSRSTLDAVIDSGGGTIVNDVTRIMKLGGVVSCYGMTAGGSVPVSMAAVLKNIEFKGSTMGSFAEFEKAVAFIGEHKIRPVVHTVLEGLDKAEEGFEIMKKGTQFGKIVIQIDKGDKGKL